MNNNILNILIINLKTENKRRISCLKELDKINISKNIKIINAIDADTAKSHKYNMEISAYNNITEKLKDTSILPTWEAFACSLSHLKCWKECHNNKYVLIIEDDFEITNSKIFNFNLQKGINYLLRHDYDFELPNDKTGYKKRPIIITFDATGNSSKILDNFQKFKGMFQNTHCYLINNFCAKYLINKIYPIKFQLDLHIGSLIKLNNLIVYNFNNSGTRQNPNYLSSVQYYFIKENELQAIFYEKLPFVLAKNIYSFLIKRSEVSNSCYDNCINNNINNINNSMNYNYYIYNNFQDNTTNNNYNEYLMLGSVLDNGLEYYN